ncbi:transcription initiation factor TFIID subunit 5 [Westerdykella ornata]|uniref:Transcription initiation factor TFIID subunit 5 n=1 Tax=Westerdykella ornata TaxID=318751 RepID=A0A6A6JS43_WESOR|nr:transcription initiation factor TFIID subunit 5 [Westerdykella ornata]KAF2278546.1 transcription initiation factor TFIID subunit 5 [Westerdykella ornata]
MSGPPPGPGPARNMSVGTGPPNAGIPPQHTPMPPQPSAVPPPAGAQTGAQTQQNLNQIVLEYLSKKGYHKTEAMLRKESDQQQTPTGGPAVSRDADAGAPKYKKSFELLQKYISDSLELYQPELKKLLWPVFVYSFLGLLRDYFIRDAETFFGTYRHMFERDHEDDVNTLGAIRLPQHLKDSRVAKLYLENKYRVTLTAMPFYNLVMFLEKYVYEGGQTIMDIIREHMMLVTVDRAVESEKSLRAIMDAKEDDGLPAEDEGIPGHNPGHPMTQRHDPDAQAARIKLQLGPYPQDQDLIDDVRATLQDEDAKNPPKPGQNSLVEEFEQRIKREPMEDGPSRDLIPLPPSLARDVSMEVQKIIEHRDRYKIEGRTGGVGPGVSVTMYTFHNTFDSVNCIDFSGDNKLVAAGMAESYIRVWSLDGEPLLSSIPEHNNQPSSSRRLVGHAGPVFAVAFSPATVNPDPEGPPTNAQFLLSCSEDKTVRLWSLDTWSCLVAYRGHDNPVWDVKWGPHGHYFLTGSNDRTARLWATDHIEPLRIYVGHDNDVDCVAFHPNNLYVFTGSCDRTVRMWHTSGGNCLRLFTGHTGNVTAIACSPDGRTLASADDQGSIILWTLETGRRKKRMRGHGKGGIWSLSWSVESTVLVSAGADKTVRVWDVLQETSDSTGASKAADGVGGPKADGTLAAKGASAGVAAAGGGAGKKSQKETGVSVDQISAFPTKDSPVYKVVFTRMNLVLAGSAYLPPVPKV